MTKEHTSEEIKYRLSDLGVQIGNIAIEYIANLEKRIAELEQENAELDCQKNRNKFCYSCANATERCFKNEIGCPCGKYKSYKDENAELKERADKADLDSVLFFNQLCKAKEIIKEFVHHYKAKTIYIENMKNLLEQAEQFISEVEK